MTQKRTHEEHVENVGAYALGALPELEARVFERHLMGCEPCQDELQRLGEAVEALPRSVTPYEAPASLKQSLMAVVHEDAARVRPAAKPSRRNWRSALPRVPRLQTGMAWAGAALLLVVGGLAGYGASGLARDDDRSRTLTATVDVKRVPDGSASLLIPANRDRGAVLRVQGLPSAGPGRIYQVWVERRGEIVPVSIFDVDARGRGAAAVPESLDDVGAVMVTREREGGSKVPTETPLLRVDV